MTTKRDSLAIDNEEITYYVSMFRHRVFTSTHPVGVGK